MDIEALRPGQLIGTFDLLSSLNRAIHETFRTNAATKLACSARKRLQKRRLLPDFAVLMMECARHWFRSALCHGLPANVEGQHGSTHA